MYERYYSANKENTLVSGINGGLLGGAFNTCHTYVAINVADACEGVLTFDIADSSKQNRLTGYSYNVKIEDGQLIISFDNLRFIGGWCLYRK